MPCQATSAKLKSRCGVIRSQAVAQSRLPPRFRTSVMLRTSSGTVATTSAGALGEHRGMGVVLALEDGQREPRMSPDVAEPGRAAERGQPERLRV